jgi:hypothetical protein
VIPQDGSSWLCAPWREPPKTYKQPTEIPSQRHSFKPQFTINMFKLAALFCLLSFTPLFAHAAPQVPDYPDVWNPNYPLNRCVDFCAFLRPGQICPKDRNNPNCLCAVYNIRLPAVKVFWVMLMSSANNVGPRRMRQSPKI